MMSSAIPVTRRALATIVASAVVLTALVVGTGVRAAHALNSPIVGITATPSRGGYWMVARDGGVFAYGNAGFYGSTGGLTLAAPIVGMAATPDGGGYWLVASDGGIFAFGNAQFHGSMGGVPLNKPIVGMAATPSGGGYWLVGSDGGIFAFGNAGFHGSTGGMTLNKPIVGMAATPSGGGYWLVGSDGGIFAFGNAGFYGSMGGTTLNKPVVGIARTANGGGYWMVASDGGIFAFGNAGFHGSTGGIVLNQPVVGIAPGPNDQGYWLAAADGGLFAFGSAPFLGGPFDGNPPAGNQPAPEAVLRDKIVQLAHQYLPYDTPSENRHNFTPSGAYTTGAWCAAFASMIWIWAGVTDWVWEANVDGFKNQAIRLGRWRGEVWPPVVGDVVVYLKSGTRHVNIVVGVRADGLIQTIGGNEGDDIVRFRDWHVPGTGRGGITGYASPTPISGARTADYTAASASVSSGETGPDPYIVPDVFVSDASVNEAGTAATFTVSVDAATSAAAGVSYSTANGTATAGADYTATSGTVTIPPYVKSVDVTVPITQDALDESTETFSLVLSNPSWALVTDGTGVASITDDDPLPVVAIGDASVEEGDSGTRNVAFPVTLSAPSGRSVSVQWSSSTGGSGTVSFPAGSTSGTASVPVTGDTTKEADQTFTVTLATPVAATLGRSVATGTVLDDDRKNALRVSAGDASVVEGRLGTRRLVFTVSLSQPSSSAVTVSYATAAGTATSADFAAASGQVSIAAGAMSATVAVDVTGDALVEGAETFTLTLSNAAGATVNRAVGTGTVLDDD
jgi:hypothetical protein